MAYAQTQPASRYAASSTSQQQQHAGPIGLAELVDETVSFLEYLNKTLEGDDPQPNDAQELSSRRQGLEQRYRDFIANRHRTEPARQQSKARLEQLRKEIDSKNRVLDALQGGLREFELEISLRSGAVLKREIAKARAKERRERDAIADDVVAGIQSASVKRVETM